MCTSGHGSLRIPKLGGQLCSTGIDWGGDAKNFIIVVIIAWPEKFDFVLVPEHDVTGILT